MTLTKLPKKPSALVKLALSDLNRVERSKGYTVDMKRFHSGGRTCRVCFAGAVMAKSLGLAKNETWLPGDFDREVRSALWALDALRSGEVGEALEELEIEGHLNENDECDLDRKVTPYKVSPADFRADMRELVRDLEEVGL